MLYERAQAFTAECKGDLDAPIVQQYIGLIRSTRCTIDEDPELDSRLVVAASNAISILNYAQVCGHVALGLYSFRDFSYCRIPYANFNTSSLYGCNFDHADLSRATFFRADLRRASFKGANLKHATTHRDEYCYRTYGKIDPWSALCVSPDEAEFACVPHGSTKAGEIWIWDSTTVDVKRRLQHPLKDAGTIQALCYSPDGQKLAVASESAAAHILDATTGKLVDEVGPHEAGVCLVTYHPDNNSHLATGTVSGSVYYWDLSSRPHKCIWKSDQVGVRFIRFSPDGSRLGYIAKDYSIRVLDSQTGALTYHLPGSYSHRHCFEFSKDGRWLAYHADARFGIHDLDTSTSVVEVTGISGLNEIFEASPSEDDDDSDSIFTHCEV